MLENGHIVFITGTKFGGIINRDPQEVPLSEILDHVSIEELQRFENRDFLAEDIREENRPPPKSRGRPRRDLEAHALDSNKHIGPHVSISSYGPRYQPRKIAVVVPAPSPTPRPPAAHDSTTFTPQKAAISVTPVKPQSVTVAAPSLDQLSSEKVGNTSVSDTSSSEDQLSSRKPTQQPRYSMLAASGLVPSEIYTDGETSRDVSVSRADSDDPSALEKEPLRKRRKLELGNVVRSVAVSPSQQLNENLHAITAGEISHRQKPCPESLGYGNKTPSNSDFEDIDPVDMIDIRDREAEKEALLRQFQDSKIPQHNPKLAPPGTATSQSSSLTAQEASILARGSPRNDKGQLHEFPPMQAPLTQVITPKRRTQKQASITPHFPQASRNTSQVSRVPSTEIKRPVIHSPSKTEVTALSNRTSSSRLRDSSLEADQSSRVNHELSGSLKVNSTNKRDGLAVNGPAPARNLDFKPLHDSQFRLQGPIKLCAAADITKFFRPKSAASKVTQRMASDAESESEDPLTQATSHRNQPSGNPPTQQPFQREAPVSHELQDDSDDSLNPETMIVQRRGQRGSPPLASITNNIHREIPDSEDDRGLSNIPGKSSGRLGLLPEVQKREALEIDDDERDETRSDNSDVLMVPEP